MSNEVNMNEIKEQLLKYQKSMEKMYYVSIGILLAYNVFNSSAMAHYFFEWLYGLFGDMPGDLKTLIVDSICMIRYMIIFPALYNLVVEVKNRRMRLLMIGMLLLGWFYAFYWRQYSNTTIFEIMIVVVASDGKDFKRVGYQSIIISGIILILSFALSIAGILPDFIKMRGDFARHAFGMLYCTDLAAHWCYLLLTYLFIKDGKMKWWFYLIVVLLSMVNILFVDARNSLIIVVLACIGSVVYQMASKRKWNISPRVGDLLQWGLVFSYVIFAGLFLILTFAYSKQLVTVLDKIPGFATSITPRLATSRRATMVFPISLFGSPYIQIGDGMGTADFLEIYTFLDDSYISVYVINGIVALLVLLALATYSQVRLKKEGHVLRMFLLALVAMHCFVEHHWTEVGYNIFLVLPFMILPKDYDEGEKRDSEEPPKTDNELEKKIP